jgi:acetylornithine deacetylase/succinyl-diaminopimelate desuccinylase-like protein
VEFVRDYAEELELSTLEEVALWEWVLDNIDFVEDIVLESLGARFASKRLFRTSCTWTGLEIGPEGSRALMDCRLVIPESADDFIDELREMAPTGGGEPVSVEAVATTWNFTESPVDHPFMGIVREELGRDLDRPGRPGVSEVTAYMMPAGTDNTFFRDPRSHLAPSGEPIARDGIPCYGFFPILTDRSLVNTQHGSDERYPVADMAPSTKRYARVVLRASHIEAD